MASVSGGSSSTTTSTGEEELKEMRSGMTSEASKKVRDHYRNLLINQQEKTDSAGDAGLPVDEIQKMILEANEAYREVRRPREGALDAEFLATCGRLVKSVIENKQYNTVEFNPAEYAIKMIEFMKGENEPQVNLLDSSIWKRFGRAVSSIYVNTPTLESVFPGFAMTVERKEKQRRKPQKEEVAARSMPKLVDSFNEEERQTEELKRLHKILKRRYKENNNKPICYFTWVINPSSYTYTIENMFHTSFLVNSCRAQILTDGNDHPVIMPMESDASKGNQDASHSQCLISLSTQEFKEAVSYYGIKHPCIPPPQTLKKRNLVESEEI